MIIEILILIFVLVMALLMLPKIKRWLKNKKIKSQQLPANYQCNLYEEKAKKEACERLMGKGEEDIRNE
ncbi:MAG: hypothetical protein MUO26_00080 [Methanotrichaceae archaeon]|nr:hypothetical protein [Methanotrichaceae archaeon]